MLGNSFNTCTVAENDMHLISILVDMITRISVPDFTVQIIQAWYEEGLLYCHLLYV
jgi:hypothetical protein